MGERKYILRFQISEILWQRINLVGQKRVQLKRYTQ